MGIGVQEALCSDVLTTVGTGTDGLSLFLLPKHRCLEKGPKFTASHCTGPHTLHTASHTVYHLTYTAHCFTLHAVSHTLPHTHCTHTYHTHIQNTYICTLHKKIGTYICMHTYIPPLAHTYKYHTTHPFPKYIHMCMYTHTYEIIHNHISISIHTYTSHIHIASHTHL